MTSCPAFAQALAEEREAAVAELRAAPSPETRLDALARLADLDELERRALAPSAPTP